MLRRGLKPCVDRLAPDLQILRPHGHKSPTHYHVNAPSLFRQDHAHVLGGRDVPRGADIGRKRVREAIEVIKLFPGEELSENSRTWLLAGSSDKEEQGTKPDNCIARPVCLEVKNAALASRLQ
jgi:hypothetical protein